MESCDINKCTAVGRWTIVLLLGLFFLKFEDLRGCLVSLVFGQQTLFHVVSLHPGVSMGTGDVLLGVTLHGLASHSGGSSNTPSCFL